MHIFASILRTIWELHHRCVSICDSCVSVIYCVKCSKFSDSNRVVIKYSVIHSILFSRKLSVFSMYLMIFNTVEIQTIETEKCFPLFKKNGNYKFNTLPFMNRPVNVWLKKTLKSFTLVMMNTSKFYSIPNQAKQ